jgi:hypothetical protein
MDKCATVSVRLFGIRHHGPFSALRLEEALATFEPDLLLVEGPPDGEAILKLATALQPPVAMLVHSLAHPERHAFYPLADFSPEWRAIQYGRSKVCPVRLIDLPLAHQFALPAETPLGEGGGVDLPSLGNPGARWDPEWWERLLEVAGVEEDPFLLLQTAVRRIRATLEDETPPLEGLREAWMRQAIRRAQRELIAQQIEGAPPPRLAVVCGAWHLPALEAALGPPGMASEDRDTALLATLPIVQTQASWVSWSDQRMARDLGDGASLADPGWARLVWERGEEAGHLWVALVFAKLREVAPSGVGAAANSIEVLRLAQALASLCDRSLPGRRELDDALRAVCGTALQSDLERVLDRLARGDREGKVPTDLIGAPLAKELVGECRRLRIPVETQMVELTLDLRDEPDRARSRLLHRIALLETGWCQLSSAAREGWRGSRFEERWQLGWSPSVDLALVIAGQWGPTLATAALARLRRVIVETQDLPDLVWLIERVLAASLPEAVAPLLEQLARRSVTSSHLEPLLAAFPPLVRLQRYGDVRGIDPAMLTGLSALIDILCEQICLALPERAVQLSPTQAEQLSRRLHEVDRAVAQLRDPLLQSRWQFSLTRLLDHRPADPRLAGRAFALLLAARQLEPEEAQRRLALALSRPGDLLPVATWLEGLLLDGGEAVDLQEGILHLLDRWLARADEASFRRLLPPLRRTFSKLPAAPRQRLAARLLSLPSSPVASEPGWLDPAPSLERASLVRPWLERLLGPHGAHS